MCAWGINYAARRGSYGQQKVKLEWQDLTNLWEAFNPRSNELRLAESKKRLVDVWGEEGK